MRVSYSLGNLGLFVLVLAVWINMALVGIIVSTTANLFMRLAHRAIFMNSMA